MEAGNNERFGSRDTLTLSRQNMVFRCIIGDR